MKDTNSGRRPDSSSQEHPLLFILSGPSGVGKDAVLSRIKQTGFPMKYITTLTTRPRRPNEKNGVDYHFIPVEQFRNMIRDNEFLEFAEVYGNWYGVPKAPVKKALSEGHDVMLKVDIQGVANIKKIVPEAVTIFLMPSSLDELAARLRRRQTESIEDVSHRLDIAESEMEKLGEFDYAIVNRDGGINSAVSEIKSIITAEKRRVKQRQVKL